MCNSYRLFCSGTVKACNSVRMNYIRTQHLSSKFVRYSKRQAINVYCSTNADVNERGLWTQIFLCVGLFGHLSFEVLFLNKFCDSLPSSAPLSLWTLFQLLLSCLTQVEKRENFVSKKFEEKKIHSNLWSLCRIRPKSVRNLRLKRFQREISRGGRAINNKSKWMQIKSNTNKLQSN